MKLSEFVEAYEDYKSGWIYSDLNSEVSFGCDCGCGCGGDSYTYESWDAMYSCTTEARDKFEKVCSQLGIEWDYD